MSEKLNRLREFNKKVSQAIENLKLLDDEMYAQIKAMSDSDVAAFLDTVNRS